MISEIRNHRRRSDACNISGKTTRKLQGDAETSVGIVECSNLELRKVKAFSQHIDTDDHTMFSCFDVI